MFRGVVYFMIDVDEGVPADITDYWNYPKSNAYYERDGRAFLQSRHRSLTQLVII